MTRRRAAPGREQEWKALKEWLRHRRQHQIPSYTFQIVRESRASEIDGVLQEMSRLARRRRGRGRA